MAGVSDSQQSETVAMILEHTKRVLGLRADRLTLDVLHLDDRIRSGKRTPGRFPFGDV
jgi:hypothetical protein